MFAIINNWRLFTRNFIGDDGRQGWVATGDGGRHPAGRRHEFAGKVIFGVLIFVVSELIMFVSLVLAFWFTRMNFPQWPPPGQPRLPALLTGMNTLILAASGIAMWVAYKRFVQDRHISFSRWLLVAAILGTLFLTLQGAEWIRLMQHGLTLSENVYGATFYIIIGFHGIHAFAALILIYHLLLSYKMARPRSLSYTRLLACQIFWYFVVIVWPPLYVVMYLL